MGFGDKSAKRRAAEKFNAERAAVVKAKEDATWEEHDKKVLAKEKRAEEKDEAHDSKLAAKEEKRLLEKEEAQANEKVAGYHKKGGKPTKITQAEIAKNAALMTALRGVNGGYPSKTAKTVTVDQPELRANPNHMDDEVEATGVDQALRALSGMDIGVGEDEADATPSRMKYKDYEASVIPKLKEENPGLKMTQLKDKAWKSWERAAENPKNQKL